jgi:hypothetical protein
MRRHARILSLTLSLVFLSGGCVSMVQKGGEILEGSAFETKTLAVYNSAGGSEIELRVLQFDDGEEAVELRLGAWPNLALRGTVPAGIAGIAASGSFEFTQALFLSTHTNGWNGFALDLLGSASFSASSGVVGILRVAGDVERVQISSGSIRLKSSRLTGSAALSPLRNRRERILALVEWMNTQTEHAEYSSRNEFEDYWKPRLFPELVPKRKRPPEYAANTGGWVRADSVSWNKAYTEFLFPEELWELRNSGALLRDWEEALPWIYMEYSWDYIIKSLNDINLLKVL